MKKGVVPLEIELKPFHEYFPYALSWITKQGKKKLEHFAYFSYDDHRSNYSKRLKKEGAESIKRFKTPPRKSN